MLMNIVDFTNIEWALLITKLIVLLLCFSVHECAHAWVAYKLGDPTGKNSGRITLNPLAHMDLWGTIMLLVFGFGYAKPVAVNSSYFMRPRRDSALVALAGPVSNFIMASVLLMTDHVMFSEINIINAHLTTITFVSSCLRYAAYINLVHMVFNLIPFPPLDGYGVLLGIVPDNIYYKILGWKKHSMHFMLGFIMVSNLTGISPTSTAARRIYNMIEGLFSLVL